MATTSTRSKKTARRQRVIYSLPPELVAEARRFADTFHEGNNSGFVAEAIRSYIDRLRKVRHTARMRESYAASAAASRKIAAAWDAASADAWRGAPTNKPAGNA